MWWFKGSDVYSHVHHDFTFAWRDAHCDCSLERGINLDVRPYPATAVTGTNLPVVVIVIVIIVAETSIDIKHALELDLCPDTRRAITGGSATTVFMLR